MTEKLINETEDKVWVTVGGTINLGNYENVKIDMGQSRTIGPDENPDELRIKICRMLIEDFIREADKIRNRPEEKKDIPKRRK